MLDEPLRLLCEQAAQEQNSQRLYELLRQINQYFEERDARAKAVGNTLRGKSA